MHSFSLGPITLSLRTTTLVLGGVSYTLLLVLWIWNDDMIRLSKLTGISLLFFPVLMAIFGDTNRQMEQKDSTTKELYGHFHLPLNVLPGRENQPPGTEWLNMGYWEVRCEIHNGPLAPKEITHLGHDHIS